VSPEPALIRVVVVDDHTLFRDGIKELLSIVGGFDVVGEGSRGDQVIELVTRLQPDILLLDVEMPGPGPRVVLRDLARTGVSTRVVVLTMHEEPAMVQDLLDRGAAAYLVKSIAGTELVAALRAVCRTDDTVLLRVSRETFGGLNRSRPAANPMSEREVEVLTLAARALSNGQIATRLFITEGTVKRHLTNIYAKLGAVSRIDAIRKAGAQRLLPDDETAW
jgi:DNA-binding NarL/FixJ family response regulator